MRALLIPTSAQSRCFPFIYEMEAGSSPTRIVPRVGGTFKVVIRSFIDSLIAANSQIYLEELINI